MRNCWLVLLSLFLVVTASVSAKVQRLSPSEGLSQSYVGNMLIDHQGYLWLATESGLNKYDGYQVKIISDEKGELDDAMIDALHMDKQGQIWTSSILNGLYRYHNGKGVLERVVAPPKELDPDFATAVFSMHSLDDNKMLLGRGGDVAMLDPQSGAITSLFKVGSGENNALVRVFFQYQHYVFIGTTHGAFVYDLKSQQVRPLQHLPPGSSGIHRDNVKSFALVEQSKLLIGTVKGLYVTDISDLDALFAQPQRPFQSTTLLSELNIWQIKPLGGGMLMLATDKGLFEYEWQANRLRKHQRLSDSPYSLSDPSVIKIVETELGDLWLGTKSDGAFFLPNKRFEFQNITADNLGGDGLSHHNIWSSVQSGDTLYLGTHNGLTQVNLATMQSEVKFKSYLSDELDNVFSIYTLIPYRRQLLMNTTRGLFSYNQDTEELTKLQARKQEDQAYLEGYLHGLYLTQDGRLYGVNQNQGFFYFDLGSQQVHPLGGDLDKHDPFLALGFSAPLADNPLQPLFFSGGQLLRFNAQTQTLQMLYRVPQSHGSLAINLNGYVVDNNNILWLSFSNHGLVALNASNFNFIKHIDLQRRGPGNLMYDLVLDDMGMVWMSSHKGLWRFNPQNEHFFQFTNLEGLATNEFNLGSVSRRDDGRLAFGSVKGATLFYPQRNIPQRALLQGVNFTSAELMYRALELPTMGPLTQVYLDHDDVGLEITFSAMAFNYQDRVIFEYQLDGSQKSFTRDNNRVVFPKLNPGEHLLQVWARDPFTGESTEPARLSISVAYPPWSSPSFITLYVIIIASLIAMWMYRRNRIQKMLMAAHKQSKESAARLKLALEGSHSGVWDWHQHESKIYQPRLREELGYSYEHCQLDQYLALIHPNERQKFRIEWLEFLSTDKGYFNCVYRLRHSSGQWRWYKDFGKVMQWEGTHPVQVAGTYTNMTRELVLEENARMFGAAFEQASDWLIIFDSKLRIVATNQALRENFDYPTSSPSSRRLNLGLSKNVRINYLRILKGLRVGEHYQCEEQVVLKTGEQVPVLLKMSAVADSEQHSTSYIVMLTDISEAKHSLETQQQQAHYDSLTGFPNRPLFMDRVEHALEQAQRDNRGCALLLINVPLPVVVGFEEQAAEQQLLSLVYRLQRAVRSQDSLGRIEAEQFALLLEDIDALEQVLAVCRKVQEVLMRPCHGTLGAANASIGVALFPEDGQQGEALLKGAELALYQAKRSGRNQFHFFQPDINAQVQRSLATEQALMIAADQCQFINHYQGIYAMQDAELQGFEVLPYWQHDEQLLAPQEYYPHIRQIRLWSKLLLQTLERAVLECRLWHRQQPLLHLSLAIKGREFSQPGSMGDIVHLLHSYDFPISCLVLEISVHDWQRLDADARQVLQKLVVSGMCLSLHIKTVDEFCVPELGDELFQQVKLGAELSALLCVDYKAYNKVSRYMPIFAAMNIEVLAMGVADDKQQRQLLNLGCTLMQGDALAQPCHGDGVADLLAKACIIPNDGHTGDKSA
ncbi:EAL domain-containing protein [Pseudoalteromonas sp. T1lg76]|uniref:EAL domain-containing protein n=1 Tax=Pseudoalteromonas sp. T1lg76 TaxID=2077103 RepID=UPI00131A3294|nr:EAL domain-containing protein [Pseudoalteromonas sp. T1lg76]